MAEHVTEFQIRLEQVRDYEFRVNFSTPGIADLIADEPPPLGRDAGPSPSRLLAAAVVNCVCASLLFCARKARVEPGRISASVKTRFIRNDQGRLRIGRIEVTIDPDFAEGQNAERCLSLFREYCTVSESVKQGIPIEIDVLTSATPRQGEAS